MLIREVMIKYNKIIPFPLTTNKIHRAGKQPTEYLFALVDELKSCTDSHRSAKVIDAIEKLRQSTLN